ncbi:hypothetical protein [Streptomyces sp. NPDC058457]|uniref:hypothetical protein n=1 Tax=Streptomyces sp. NPDC058457 TaxID=3346507 RepID=UPI00364C94DD
MELARPGVVEPHFPVAGDPHDIRRDVEGHGLVVHRPTPTTGRRRRPTVRQSSWTGWVESSLTRCGRIISAWNW